MARNAAAARAPQQTSVSDLPLPFARPPLPSDDTSDDEWVERWTQFLLHSSDVVARLLSILARPAADSGASHHSVPLHVLAAACRHRACGEFLLSHSTRCLPLVDRALVAVVALLQQYCAAPGTAQTQAQGGARFHVRPYCLPSTHNRSSIGAIRSADVGRLVCVLGNVMRVQAARMYEYASEWRCEKCGGHFYAYADDDQESRIEQPKHCRASEQPNANADNASWSGRQCRSTFISQTAVSLARDVQHVRIQDNLHRSYLSLPRSITLRLTDEQCERLKVGDVVQVCGMVRRQWAALSVGQRVNIDLYLDAYHIAVIGSSAASAAAASGTPNVPASEFDAYWEQQRSAGRTLTARNHILSSVAPTLVGMFIPKLVCLLALIGGVRKEDGGGGEGEEGAADAGRSDVINLRGDIHVLMVGDAGVGKSVLLQSACGLSPRGVLTTGAGTTSAGLTVAATRAAGSRSGAAFSLEPGALVLADSGVCCIDEFNCISKADRTSLLEAMEQQTISIAKGGQVTRLNTRTAVIAALNPKQGKYDHDLDLSVNTALGSALLSRFDVILALLDTRDAAWDEKVAEQLLHALPNAGGGGSGGVVVKKQEREEAGDDDEDEVLCMTQRATQRLQLTLTQTPASASQLLTQRWSVATVHSYIAYLKSNSFPVLSPDCEALLKRYYQVQRRSDGRKQARVGVRLLESLIRLTQAHARLMWRHDECELLDAVMAVVLMEHSVLSCGLLVRRKANALVWTSQMPTTMSALHAEFSDRPGEEYEAWEATLLDRLELSSLRRSSQPSDDEGAAEGGNVQQPPQPLSFRMAEQQRQQPEPFRSLQHSWPLTLPPSMANLPLSVPPPPLPVHSLPAHAPPRPSVDAMQQAAASALPPRQPSAPPPTNGQLSHALPRPSPPAPQPQPSTSILKAPSLAGMPPPGRLLSRKSTVSFAAAPPSSPLPSTPLQVNSPPVPPAVNTAMSQLAQSTAQPSQPDLFTLPPSPPQSQGRRLRPSNPFMAPAPQSPKAAAPPPVSNGSASSAVAPSFPQPMHGACNHASMAPPPAVQPSTALSTPTKPAYPPSAASTPSSRPPLASLQSPYSASPSSTLPSLPPTPSTAPSPLTALLGANRPLPGGVHVSAVSLSSSFAAAIKANPFVVHGAGGAGGGGGGGASRWSTGITDEELDGLDLDM